MNANRILEIVDAIERDKKVDREIAFQAIEAGLLAAAVQSHGAADELVVKIDRTSGEVSASNQGVPLDAQVIAAGLATQAAKQVIIRKVREAEQG